MRRDKAFLIIFIASLIIGFTFINSTPVSANRGMVVIGPAEVNLEESGQNAMVAWNGSEEVLILSTDVRSSESTSVLEILPLPSNPEKVEEGNFDSFTKLVEIVNRKVRDIRGGMERFGTLGREGYSVSSVTVTFHEKIGAHDVTVVKVNDLDYFIDWLKEFTISKDFEYKEISSEFRNTIGSYLDRDVSYFVFDVIETTETTQSIKPLLYRFKTEYLYYPLEITATSDAGWATSRINIFLIAKGVVKETTIGGIGLYPVTGFDYYIELGKEELEEVSPELGDLFKSDPLVMNAFYYGSLNQLHQDLMVYEQNIYVPTFWDKFYQRISAFPAVEFLSQMWEELTFPGTYFGLDRVFCGIFFISFIAGTLSAIFLLARPIRSLLKKLVPKSFGYNLIGYTLSLVIVCLLVFYTPWQLSIPLIPILIILGFAVIVFLVFRLLMRGFSRSIQS